MTTESQTENAPKLMIASSGQIVRCYFRGNQIRNGEAEPDTAIAGGPVMVQ
jgi:hypothetical protein